MNMQRVIRGRPQMAALPFEGTPGKTSWYQMKKKGRKAEVMIDDFIGYYGISAKRFCDELKTLDADTIDVRINSGGGDFFDACAMYTALQEHPATVTCHVDGLAASAASLIAIAGDKCLISPSGFMMIHNVLCMCYGNAAEMRRQAELLDKLSVKAADLYAAKTGKTSTAMVTLMDEETWFTAEEAVKAGLCDAVKSDGEDEDDEEMRMVAGGVARQLPRLEQHTKNVPAPLRRYAARLSASVNQPKKEISMIVFCRNGKYFLKVGNTEVPVPAPAMKDGKHYLDESCAQEVSIVNVSETPGTGAGSAGGVTQAQMEAAVRQAKTDAVTEERTRNKEFRAILAAAGVDGEAQAELEKFYDQGMAVDQLKFLATRAIGQRAKPLGEGGAGDGTAAGQESQADAEIEKACAKRFREDGRCRSMWGVTTADEKNDKYQAALARYVAREKAYAKETTAENQKKQVLRAKD